MYPEIYSPEEIAFIMRIMKSFRMIISDDYDLYDFSLREFDQVFHELPNVDLTDTTPGNNDESGHVLHNMFAFVCADSPEPVVEKEEIAIVKDLWAKLRNA